MINHDDISQKATQLTDNNELKQRVSELFLIAIATGFHRGLTPIANFYAFSSLPKHIYTPLNYDETQFGFEKKFIPCDICGMTNTPRWEIDMDDLACGRTPILADFKGYYDLLYVQNLNTLSVEKLTPQDLLLLQPYSPKYNQTLISLLNFIENVPIGESPSQLEKSISKAKILPKSNLASRTWALRILAQLGILPCKTFPEFKGGDKFYPFSQYWQWETFMHEKAGVRADPVFPFSLWRGGDGVNWEQAYKIFPQLTAN